VRAKAPTASVPAAAVPAAPAKAGAYGAEKSAKEPTPPSSTDMTGYTLPPLTLLDPPEPPVVEDMGEITARAKILEQTLATFKIEGRVVHIERGPRVTMYEISLAPGIRLNKVTSLADNIAMQLQAESVRIIAPIPGKNTIGIEIPNMAKELVSLSEIVAAVNREKKRQALPVCLGKDVAGQPLVADLARMPHLLIAGATGRGKSVCINSIILSVMMCCKPDEAQMIMVDPKVVELSRFKDIPHLMSPVITDMKRAVSVLEWICQKMDERYEMMSQVSVNNIAKFNALGDAGIRERLDEFASLEEIDAFPKSMPYMVVIIDELADLMMVAGKEVEQHITRLAAKSRAVGIHLILATQRPSVDVITGLIKANMPCRIAFQVASRVDSRTILDQNGAETLLGQGDMLYLPPGVGKLTRAQGVFVSDEELFRVVDYTKSEAEPQYHADLLGPVIGGGGKSVDVSAFDELFIQAGQEIIQNQRGSVSLLQRKFGIGYGRASRIIDQLATVGLLGPFRDGKSREILLTMEEFNHKFGGTASASKYQDEDDEGSMAGLRDDERERPQPDYGDGDDDRPF
jgi:S-DNA-T family DNA segregation ATPase FtsK/SpoIIIE